MKKNRGLSGIVTTLIIILLVLVAVGVIWGVVNNLLDRGTGQIETTTKCIDIDIRATKVIPSDSAGGYNITLERKPTGENVPFGAKVIFFNGNTNTEPFDFGEELDRLRIVTTNIPSGLVNATKVQVTPYFYDDSGQEVLCPTSTEFEFA